MSARIRSPLINLGILIVHPLNLLFLDTNDLPAACQSIVAWTVCTIYWIYIFKRVRAYFPVQTDCPVPWFGRPGNVFWQLKSASKGFLHESGDYCRHSPNRSIWVGMRMGLGVGGGVRRGSNYFNNYR